MDPKFNNNNHLIDDLKNEDNDNVESEVSKVVSSFANRKNSDPLKEKMMKNLFKIAIATIVIVLLLFIFSIITSRNKSYSDIEDIMKRSAERYYSANKNLLPKATGGTVEVSAQKLANLNYMKDLSSYKKETCSGKVVVENNDDDYIYVAYLDCGSKYKTTELFRKVTAEENVVTSQDGLYLNNDEYVFRGENINNYITFGSQLWRIVKVTKDNEVVLIKEGRYNNNNYPFDDRYNSSKGYNTGINDFNVSRMKQYLDNIYDATDDHDILFPEKSKSYIVKHSYCIGKRSTKSDGKDYSAECSSLSEMMKVGLLSASDYMNASLDSACTNISSSNCQNYNYLVNHQIEWWLSTSVSDNSYETYYITSYGAIKTANDVSYKSIRPVIYLNSKTMFKDGDGSEKNPYQVK